MHNINNIWNQPNTFFKTFHLWVAYQKEAFGHFEGISANITTHNLITLILEKIFTSMDEKPITHERIRILDGQHDRDVVDRMGRLAREVFGYFNLDSLVRLDMRRAANGDLFLLEANPKPDLRRPTDTIASITCSALDHHGLSYQDLIMSIFAERLIQLTQISRGESPISSKLVESAAPLAVAT